MGAGVLRGLSVRCKRGGFVWSKKEMGGGGQIALAIAPRGIAVGFVALLVGLFWEGVLRGWEGRVWRMGVSA